MTQRTRTDFIAVHCSATTPLMDIGVETIRRWHTQPPNNWTDIGYHLVIRRNGIIERGRAFDDVGSHVKGFNALSIGVCLVGGVTRNGDPDANYTDEQWTALLVTLRFLRKMYPTAKIQGHRDFPDVPKACPSFDVREWLKVNAADLL